jgi:hypothetical protein
MSLVVPIVKGYSPSLFRAQQKRPTMRAGGLGGGLCQKAEFKRKLFSVSTAGSPTKPLTRAVRRLVQQSILYNSDMSVVNEHMLMHSILPKKEERY